MRPELRYRGPRKRPPEFRSIKQGLIVSDHTAILGSIQVSCGAPAGEEAFETWTGRTGDRRRLRIGDRVALSGAQCDELGRRHFRAGLDPWSPTRSTTSSTWLPRLATPWSRSASGN